MLIIDGEKFKIDVLSCKRTADFLDKHAKRTENGDLKRELIGVYIQPYKSNEGYHQMGKGDAGADNQECMGYYPLCIL